MKLKIINKSKPDLLDKLKKIRSYYEKKETKDLELLFVEMDSRHEDLKQIALLVALFAFFLAFLKPYTELIGDLIYGTVSYFFIILGSMLISTAIYSKNLRNTVTRKNIIKIILDDRKDSKNN